MKAVQVMLDEELLLELDATPEVKELGRSAVLRSILAEYLRHRRRRMIRERYERAYGESGAFDEFDGWAEEGVWPDA